ncbi:MAG: glycosyltransferase [Flavobacteriales bacterium]|nr:glycosyltransferase [Flavobacteriales bacterium]
MRSKISISVVMICYNHEKFIEQELSGLGLQQFSEVPVTMANG